MTSYIIGAPAQLVTCGSSGTPQTIPWSSSTNKEERQYTTTMQPAKSDTPQWIQWLLGILSCIALAMLAQWAMKEMAVNKVVDTVKDKASDLTSYFQNMRSPFPKLASFRKTMEDTS
jgi:hypothetical protein